MPMPYPVFVPRWVQRLLPAYQWRGPTDTAPTLYLTFDDGPIPEVTPWVLDQLAAYGAKATFFCVGANVQRHPALYARLLAEGHQTGNHTQHHLDGWRYSTAAYMADVARAAEGVASPLFRPPYGRLRWGQARALRRAGFQIVLWEALAGDFDPQLHAEDCWQRLKGRLRDGSIVVLHDSHKAWPRLEGILPQLLKHYQGLGYQFKALPLSPLAQVP